MTTNFADHTPPGLFDLNDDNTVKFENLFNSISEYCYQNSVDFDNFFRLFHITDYGSKLSSEIPYIYYLLNVYGLSFFIGIANQGKNLIKLAETAWSESTIQNIYTVIDYFSLVPFEWVIFDSSFQIFTGISYQRKSSTAFIFYSDVVFNGTIDFSDAPDFDLPGISNESYFFDNNQQFINLGWINGNGDIEFNSVAGYAKSPATYFETSVQFVDNIPTNSPANKEKIYIVKSDGSDDNNSLYFTPSDGATAARKFSAEFDKQGLSGQDPTEAIRAVAAPVNPVPFSPPVSGLSKGFGQYSLLSDNVLYSNQIGIKVTLTEDGFNNLPTINYFLQKIKPTEKVFILIYTYLGQTVEHEIVDIRHI